MTCRPCDLDLDVASHPIFEMSTIYQHSSTLCVIGVEGSFLRTNSQQLVDPSSPDFFFIERRRNCSRLICFLILDILSGFGDIRDQNLRLYKIQNFACFRPTNFLGDSPRIIGLVL